MFKKIRFQHRLITQGRQGYNPRGSGRVWRCAEVLTVGEMIRKLLVRTTNISAVTLTKSIKQLD